MKRLLHQPAGPSVPSAGFSGKHSRLPGPRPRQGQLSGEACRAPRYRAIPHGPMGKPSRSRRPASFQ